MRKIGVVLEKSLVSWWENARPFFHEHAPQIVTQVDDDANRLTKLAGADTSFCVCVLGNSAVGKSTLLNAMVAGEDTVLPAGGIGPLTALATEVRYSAEPYLLVTYRTRKVLAGYRLQVEKRLKKLDRNFADLGSDDVTEADSHDLEAEIAEPHEQDNDPQASSEREKTFKELCAQIAQILTADQFKDVPLGDLVVGFRAVLGSKVA
jgi:hypothetical protein